MPLQKQNLAVSFSAGIGQKTDPLQELPRELSAVVNGVYNKEGRLDKRQGFNDFIALPDGANATTLTTFSNNLTAVGDNVYAYSDSSQSWIDKGRFQPVSLNVLSAQKNSRSQERLDVAYSGTGLACLTYLDSDGTWRYQINDSVNGAVLVAPVEPESGAVNLRCSKLGVYFIVSYTITVSATPRIRYVAVPFAALTSPLATVERFTTVSVFSYTVVESLGFRARLRAVTLVVVALSS